MHRISMMDLIQLSKKTSYLSLIHYLSSVIPEPHKPPLLYTSASVPPEVSHGESLFYETTASFSEQKR